MNNNEVKLTQEKYNRLLDMEDKLKQLDQILRKLSENISNLDSRLEKVENATRSPYDDIFKNMNNFGGKK